MPGRRGRSVPDNRVLGLIRTQLAAPENLLPFKPRYQSLANRLPRGTVLLVLPRRRLAQRRLFVRLADQFTAHGHQIATRTVEAVAHR